MHLRTFEEKDFEVIKDWMFCFSFSQKNCFFTSCCRRGDCDTISLKVLFKNALREVDYVTFFYKELQRSINRCGVSV